MHNPIKKICCIGAGYVGGPTMSVIADKCPDIQVTVIDINVEKIRAWNESDLSKLPVFEPGLSDIIKRCRGKNLHFSSEIKENIADADMVFISVNTPTKTKGIGAGEAVDLKWIEASARQISKYAKGDTIIVEKSTLPIKTGETIKKILEADNSNDSNQNPRKFTVLSNPEFLAEGSAIKDLEKPDRVLIGGEDNLSINSLINIYSRWVSKNKIITTNLWSAELSKLISNAFLAQRISSINSITALCEITDSSIKEVSMAVGSDKRIGNLFLKAGPGFGGSCFKKDILNLVYICNYYGLNEVANYWRKVIEINDWQKDRIVKIIVKKLFGNLSEKTLTILGFSFKANTNDTRESPALDICKNLLNEGANIKIYDPKVSEERIMLDFNEEISELNKVKWRKSSTILEACENSDAIIILTEWDEFRVLDWEKISSIMRKPSWIFDTRNISNLDKARNYGINIWSLGEVENHL